MCGIWTMNQWREVVNDKARGYSLLGEYKDEHGNPALMVVDQFEDVTNIYSQDGHKVMSFWLRSSDTDVQKRLAAEAMAKHGFSPVPAPRPIRVPGIAELSQDETLRKALLAPNVHQEEANAIYADPASIPEPSAVLV